VEILGALDILPLGRKSVGSRMKNRLRAAIVLLLYLSVALVFGVLHDHHDHGTLRGHDDCAACKWQISAVGNVPVVCVFATIHIVATAATTFQSSELPAPFVASTASRAPPIAST
jgi:hypothetical protein